MIALEQARQHILASLDPLPGESVPLLGALGRRPLDDLAARFPAPPFDNSAFDGYAVRAADLVGARADRPIRLPVVGRTAAGAPPGPPLAQGTCHRIFTGAPMPPGADAVLMQEDTQPVDSHPDEILATDSVRPREGVRFAGEDFQMGAILAPAGTPLSPAHLAILAAGGVDRVQVPQRPRMHLLSTGNELVEPGTELAPGRIPDSNGVLLEALARRAGANVVGRRRIPDEINPTLEALAEAARTSDLILTTGGVSVGDADLLRPAVERLGGRLDFWRIAMKPGKPFVFGRIGSAWWCGLPGNPAAVFVTWWQLVRPALMRLGGARDYRSDLVCGTLAEPVSQRGDRRHFFRVRIDAAGSVRLTGGQGSHMQGSLAQANALLDVPPNTHWDAGHPVCVERTDA